MDKMAGPNVSFIQRFHGRGQPLYSGQNGWSQCGGSTEVEFSLLANREYVREKSHLYIVTDRLFLDCNIYSYYDLKYIMG